MVYNKITLGYTPALQQNCQDMLQNIFHLTAKTMLNAVLMYLRCLKSRFCAFVKPKRISSYLENSNVNSETEFKSDKY